MKLKPKSIHGKLLSTKPVVTIHHSQTIKQSFDWQSCDANYGLSRSVDDNPKAIKKGFKDLEKIVEACLKIKTRQQQLLLKAMSSKKEADGTE